MKNKIIKILFLILIIMLAVVNVAYAAPTDIYSFNSNTKLQTAGTYIAGWLRYAAIIICVIMLMLKGIKFITSSPEGKADVKKELIPWFVGLVILVAMIPFLNWIIEITQNNINSIDSNNVGSINVLNLIRV